jgi:hypothetical protein
MVRYGLIGAAVAILVAASLVPDDALARRVLPRSAAARDMAARDMRVAPQDMVALAMQVAPLLRDEVMGIGRFRVAPSRVQRCEMACIAAQPTGPPPQQPEQRLTALTAITTTATITAATTTHTASGFVSSID